MAAEPLVARSEDGADDGVDGLSDGVLEEELSDELDPLPLEDSDEADDEDELADLDPLRLSVL